MTSFRRASRDSSTAHLAGSDLRIHPNVALELIPAAHASLGHLVIPPTDEILLWRGLEALMLGRATIT